LEQLSNGSVAVTPNNKLDINRLEITAATTPIAMPSTASLASLKVTNFIMSKRSAPSAILIPISRVRCVTVYDMTP
jgi:hypothetical protein